MPSLSYRSPVSARTYRTPRSASKSLRRYTGTYTTTDSPSRNAELVHYGNWMEAYDDLSRTFVRDLRTAEVFKVANEVEFSFAIDKFASARDLSLGELSSERRQFIYNMLAKLALLLHEPSATSSYVKTALERLRRTSYGHVDPAEVLDVIRAYAPSLPSLERSQLSRYLTAQPASYLISGNSSEVNLYDTMRACRLKLSDGPVTVMDHPIVKTPLRTYADDLALTATYTRNALRYADDLALTSAYRRRYYGSYYPYYNRYLDDEFLYRPYSTWKYYYDTPYWSYWKNRVVDPYYDPITESRLRLGLPLRTYTPLSAPAGYISSSPRLSSPIRPLPSLSPVKVVSRSATPVKELTPAASPVKSIVTAASPARSTVSEAQLEYEWPLDEVLYLGRTLYMDNLTNAVYEKAWPGELLWAVGKQSLGRLTEYDPLNQWNFASALSSTLHRNFSWVEDFFHTNGVRGGGPIGASPMLDPVELRRLLREVMPDLDLADIAALQAVLDGTTEGYVTRHELMTTVGDIADDMSLTLRTLSDRIQSAISRLAFHIGHSRVSVSMAFKDYDTDFDGALKPCEVMPFLKALDPVLTSTERRRVALYTWSLTVLQDSRRVTLPEAMRATQLAQQVITTGAPWSYSVSSPTGILSPARMYDQPFSATPKVKDTSSPLAPNNGATGSRRNLEKELESENQAEDPVTPPNESEVDADEQ